MAAAVLAYALSVVLVALLPAQAAQNPVVVTSSDGCLPDSAIHCINSRPRINVVSSNNNNNNSLGKSLINGTISSMLMPVSEGGDMMGNSMMTGETRQQAMRFSMAQNVTWILSGNWSLSETEEEGGVNATRFNAVFTKVTTDGEMRHTHMISNSTLSPITRNATSAGVSNNILHGTTDLYFNNELAWKKAGITLTFVDNEVLVIEFDSDDIDSHFHDMPIYGVIIKS